MVKENVLAVQSAKVPIKISDLVKCVEGAAPPRVVAGGVVTPVAVKSGEYYGSVEKGPYRQGRLKGIGLESESSFRTEVERVVVDEVLPVTVCVVAPGVDLPETGFPEAVDLRFLTDDPVVVNEDASVARSISSEHDPVFLEVSRTAGKQLSVKGSNTDTSLPRHPVDSSTESLLVGQFWVVGTNHQRLLVQFNRRPRRSGHVEAAVTLRHVALDLNIARPTGEKRQRILEEDDVKVNDDGRDLETQRVKDNLRLVVRLPAEARTAPVAGAITVEVGKVPNARDRMFDGEKLTCALVGSDEEIVCDVERLE